MSNLLTNWWRGRQFSAALKKGDTYLAQQLLEDTRKAGARLSLLERVFRDKLQSAQSSAQYEREVLVLREQISQGSQTIEELSRDKQQVEQSLADVRNQLWHKEQEVVSIQLRLQARGQEIQRLLDHLRQKEQEVVSTQQRLEARGRETNSIQQQLEARGQEIHALHNQLSQREQGLASIQQQLAAGRREADSIQQQVEVRGQEIHALRNQLNHKEQEVVSTQQQLETRGQEIHSLRNQLNQIPQSLVNNLFLSPHQKFIESVEESFRLTEISEKLLQCTGIDEGVFYDLEKNIVKYLKSEFERYTPQGSLSEDLKATHDEDIVALKRGQDPQYDSYLSPHVYFMVYFMEGVYSAYLAWFLVYKFGLLRPKVNILDIGAGSGAMIYGLFSLLKSASDFTSLPQSHISYCSLEQQSLLQHHGLEFWKQYLEDQTPTAVNTYCRFKTIDIFKYGNNSHKGRNLPKNFFDFIVISHCIFADKDPRVESHKIYKEIFSDSLKEDGYVLIVVQGRRLFQAYSRNLTENEAQEESLIINFLDELGLKLEWYKYMTSTGKRVPTGGSEFGRFASKNLPPQTHMSLLLRQYLEQRYDSHYVLDDYTILAKKEL